MNLTTLFDVRNIILDIDSQDHIQSLIEVMRRIPQNGRLRNKEKALKDLLDREKLSTTGIGGGFAVPHVFTEEANAPTLVFARSSKGIEFNSLDSQPVHLLLLAFAHPRKKSFFILCLYHIVRLLKDPEVFSRLMDAQNPEEIIQVFDRKGAFVSPELLDPVSLGDAGLDEARKPLTPAGADVEFDARVKALQEAAAARGNSIADANGRGNGSRIPGKVPELGYGKAGGKRAMNWLYPKVSEVMYTVRNFLARAVKEARA